MYSKDRPETGFGCIQADITNQPTLLVGRFIEKPNEATATPDQL